MPKKPEIVELDRREKLRHSRRQTTSMSLPLAVHHRLDVLAELSDMTGASRAEIVGMLIAEAKLDPAWLDEAVMNYRGMLVGEVIPGKQTETEGQEESNVVSLEKRGPGRPRRQTG